MFSWHLLGLPARVERGHGEAARSGHCGAESGLRAPYSAGSPGAGGLPPDRPRQWNRSGPAHISRDISDARPDYRTQGAATGGLVHLLRPSHTPGPPYRPSAQPSERSVSECVVLAQRRRNPRCRRDHRRARNRGDPRSVPAQHATRRRPPTVTTGQLPAPGSASSARLQYGHQRTPARSRRRRPRRLPPSNTGGGRCLGAHESGDRVISGEPVDQNCYEECRAGHLLRLT